jgi:predicted  nucleic acid-binding Zn-ribbon protein
MNVFEMVFAIVVIATIGSIIRAKMGVTRAKMGVGRDMMGNDINLREPGLNEENRQLRQEITGLKDRIAVLERVITDTNSSSANLDREIESLRNRDR